MMRKHYDHEESYDEDENNYDNDEENNHDK